MGEREQLYEHCSGVRHTESEEVTHSQVSGVEKCGCASVRLTVSVCVAASVSERGETNGFCPIPYLGPAFGRPFRTSTTQLNQKPKVCIMQAAVVLSCPGRGAWGRPGARTHLRTADMGRADPALSAQTGDSRAARAQHPTLARTHQKPNSAHPNTWHPNWCALPQGSPRVSLRACVRRATQSIKYA